MPERTDAGLEKVTLRGGKRNRIAHSAWLDDWWIGEGKEPGCDFEGTWEHMAILAARILAHPNTQKVAPNLHRPDPRLTPEQEAAY